jgi:ABC-2 type transport system ATP-binding protein
MDPAISIKGVTKTFGEVEAVRDLDLAIPQGGLYGFIGPNGAGKTTTLRLIMSILFPDSGQLSILGHRSALEAKHRIGYLPEERGVYRKMTVRAFLTYMARLKDADPRTLPVRINQGLERVGLADVDHKRCEELSKGMSQKIQFLAATLHEPDLLILDEPFSGLDPVSTRLIREIIDAEHRRGATILLSTHVMPHAEQLCEHVVMMHQGRKVLDDSLIEIRRRYDPRTVLLDPLDADADLSLLERIDCVERVTRIDGTCEVTLKAGTDTGAAMQTLAGAIAPARLELARPKLEDIFIQIVSDHRGAASPDPMLRADLRGESDAEVRS